MTTFKARIEAQTEGMTPAQQARFRAVAGNLEKLNAAIRDAVNSGLSIELQRSARHHDSQGAWGDMMMPQVVRMRSA